MPAAKRFLHFLLFLLFIAMAGTARRAVRGRLGEATLPRDLDGSALCQKVTLMLNRTFLGTIIRLGFR